MKMNKPVLFAVLAMVAFGTMANKCTVSNTPATPSQTEEQKSAPSTPEPSTPQPSTSPAQ